MRIKGYAATAAVLAAALAALIAPAAHGGTPDASVAWTSKAHIIGMYSDPLEFDLTVTTPGGAGAPKTKLRLTIPWNEADLRSVSLRIFDLRNGRSTTTDQPTSGTSAKAFVPVDGSTLPKGRTLHLRLGLTGRDR